MNKIRLTAVFKERLCCELLEQIKNGNNTFYVHSTSGQYNGSNGSHWDTTSDQRIKKNITNNCC